MRPGNQMSLRERKWTELSHGQPWSEDAQQPACRDRHWTSREHELKELKAPHSQLWPLPARLWLHNQPLFSRSAGLGPPTDSFSPMPATWQPPGPGSVAGARFLILRATAKGAAGSFCFCCPENALLLSAAPRAKAPSEPGSSGPATKTHLGGPHTEPRVGCTGQIPPQKFCGSRVRDRSVSLTPKTLKLQPCS